jgi:hypothetical protein
MVLPANSHRVRVLSLESLLLNDIRVLCDRRKNVGYLWAMNNGAQVIYDTDDSSVIRGCNITVFDTSLLPTYIKNTSTTLINVYDTYGLPNRWPRGFPMAHASEWAPTVFEREMVRPLIQQGAPFRGSPARTVPKGQLLLYCKQSTVV